ncbi:MAG: WYL domain-containing transcriptional regulator [Erysipelotrichaceae bacterium]
MEKKIVLLQLLSLFQQHTDETHPMTVKQIIDFFKNEHQTEITRQTIYNSVKILNEANYMIESSGRKKGYYYDNRLLEKSEVMFISHSIIANNIIPLNQSNELIQKIMNTQSDYFKQGFKNNLNLCNLDKKENQDIFLNVELLSDAIDTLKEVSFRYTTYNYDKEMVYKNEKIYQVIPRFILCKESKMYLVGEDKEYHQQRQYRLDRIRNLEISNQCFSSYEQDAYSYAKNRHYMYAGEMLEVKLKCCRSMLDEVVERFGKDSNIVPINDDYFYVDTKMTYHAAIFFACQFIQYTQIIEPEEIKQDIQSILQDAQNKYNNHNKEGN